MRNSQNYGAQSFMIGQHANHNKSVMEDQQRWLMTSADSDNLGPHKGLFNDYPHHSSLSVHQTINIERNSISGLGK